MDTRTNSKVYINPNYKSVTSSTAPLKQNNSIIYVNQKFRENNTKLNPGKIFVNPNFIKANNNTIVKSQKCYVNEHFKNTNTHATVGNYTADIINTVNIDHTSSFLTERNVRPNLRHVTINNTQHNENHKIVNVSLATDLPDTLPKSRYSFVRNIDSKRCEPSAVSSQPVEKAQDLNLNISRDITNQSSNTPISKSRYHFVKKKQTVILSSPIQAKSRMLKIGKYKTISIDNPKKPVHLNESNTKLLSSKHLHSHRTLSNRLSTTLHLNKSVTRNSRISNSSSYRIKPNIQSNLKKKESIQCTKIETKRKLKLNNIPCPLFTKYGKCLRNQSGNCVYVHDKKHVSLCRKFLKGICHDETCSLSHELSVKKMPTCYFYLRGKCFKDDCPYLHVKLSEKTNICPDFVKGYCDKGDKCLLRHVVKDKFVSGDHNKKNTTKIRRKHLTDTVIIKKLVDHQTEQAKADEVNFEENQREQNDVEVHVNEGRYFIETVNEDATGSGAIKPTRCKLGDLPSYIQL